MSLCFGDIVVIEKNLIGVIVKTWIGSRGVIHEVYVRNFSCIKEYPERKIKRYMVRHKELDEQDLRWQHNAIYNHTT